MNQAPGIAVVTWKRLVKVAYSICYLHSTKHHLPLSVFADAAATMDRVRSAFNRMVNVCYFYFVSCLNWFNGHQGNINMFPFLLEIINMEGGTGAPEGIF